MPSGSYSMLFSFVLPVALILAVNLVLFVRIFRAVMSVRLRSQVADLNTPVARAKRAAKVSLSFMSLMGLGWVLGLVAIGDARRAVEYVFVAANTLQGVFIFVFHCALDPAVQQALRAYLARRQRSSRSALQRKSTVILYEKDLEWDPSFEKANAKRQAFAGLAGADLALLHKPGNNNNNNNNNTSSSTDDDEVDAIAFVATRVHGGDSGVASKSDGKSSDSKSGSSGYHSHSRHTAARSPVHDGNGGNSSSSSRGSDVDAHRHGVPHESSV
jgi:hypothetical protein